jgi:hypothetical protein
MLLASSNEILSDHHDSCKALGVQLARFPILFLRISWNTAEPENCSDRMHAISEPETSPQYTQNKGHLVPRTEPSHEIL